MRRIIFKLTNKSLAQPTGEFSHAFNKNENNTKNAQVSNTLLASHGFEDAFEEIE